jgi:hypothetical protein
MISLLIDFFVLCLVGYPCLVEWLDIAERIKSVPHAFIHISMKREVKHNFNESARIDSP